MKTPPNKWPELQSSDELAIQAVTEAASARDGTFAIVKALLAIASAIQQLARVIEERPR